MRIFAAIALLCLVPFGAEAKQSPYPGVTQYDGDRISARQAQIGITARRVAPTRRQAPPRAQQRWRGDVPLPTPRPFSVPGETSPQTIWGGVQREAGRAIGRGRPRAWCGWWLGHHLGMPLRHLWLARNWAGVGSNAGGPQVGAVVVWRHHVGIITGRSASGWIVKSGNDSHAVRERVRSIAGAIAFRRIGGWSS